MAKKKRKATKKQLANLAKGRAALKKKRAAAKKKNPHRKKVRRVAKKKTAKRRPSRAATHKKARAALRTGSRTAGKPANPVKPSSRAHPHYAIKQGGRFYDGAGFTKDKKQAALWMDLGRCKRIAQKVADATGKACEIVH